MKQEIRFCKSADGTGLAYAISGSGAPLLRAQHWITHLEHDAECPAWRPSLDELSRRFRLVRFDQRGCGLSDADAAEISFEAWVRDLEAIADAAALERFPILGYSQGAAIAIAYAARHPERVSHLVLVGGYARGWRKRDPSAYDLDRAQTMAHLIELGWGTQDPTFRQVFTTNFMPGATADQQRSFSDMMRVSAAPDMAVRIFRAFGEIDVRDEARAIRCPSLVVHARGDLRVPFEEGRTLASLIPGARFLPLDSVNHLLLDTEPAWRQFLEAVDGFLPAGGGNEFPQLTVREREVLALIAQGFDNAQIAARLELAEKTVRNHITRIFDKIEVENRSQAIVAARLAGLGTQSTAA
ncbi:MAG: alpha/beta fold hydrolase [Burkholderiales bacterium]|nr:alpha/beta fold hydrolase [Burkholderiales bacterium]